MSGSLFVVSGPAGVGKGTVIREVFKLTGSLIYSVSCTTRPPRPGEVEGKSYYFVGGEEFSRLVEEGNFLEWAEVHGHRYGTRRDVVEKTLAAGVDVLLEIDVQGALQVKQKMADAVTVFIKPPSFAELERRLRKRGTENSGELALRLENAKKELAEADRYDYIIVNERVNEAARRFVEILKKVGGRKMIYLDLEKIYRERDIPNKYIMTLVVAQRARQLSIRKDAFSSSEKYITQALGELADGRIAYKVVGAGGAAKNDEPVEEK